MTTAADGNPARTLMPIVATLPAASGEALLAAAAGWLRGHADAPATHRAYLRDLHSWLTCCADSGIDPRAARRLDAASWADHLATAPSPATGRPLAAFTRARMLAAVSSWCGYLLSLDEDLVVRNPIAPIHRPSVATNQSAAIGLTAHQAGVLIAAADADPYRAALRTRATVRLLLEVGLRVAEICGLDVADYGHNRGHHTLRYTAKGQRTMTRAVHPATVDAYLAHRAATAGIAVDQLAGPLLVTTSGTWSAGVRPAGYGRRAAADRRCVARTSWRPPGGCCPCRRGRAVPAGCRKRRPPSRHPGSVAAG